MKVGGQSSRIQRKNKYQILQNSVLQNHRKSNSYAMNRSKKLNIHVPHEKMNTIRESENQSLYQIQRSTLENNSQFNSTQKISTMDNQVKTSKDTSNQKIKQYRSTYSTDMKTRKIKDRKDSQSRNMDMK